MKEKDNIWLKKVKQRLDGYAEPVPAGSWEKLSAKLSPQAEKRIFPYRRYAAAAVLLVLLVPSLLFFFHSPGITGPDRVAIPGMEPLTDPLLPGPPPDRLAVIPEPSPEREPVEQPVFPDKVKMGARAALEQSEPVAEPDWEQEQERLSGETTVREETREEDARESLPVIHRPSGKDKLHLPVAQDKKSRDNRLAMGVALSSNALSSTSSGAVFGTSLATNKVNMEIMSDGVSYLTVPEDEVLVIEGGMAYYRNISDVPYHHHLPFTVGLSVRKALAKGFSIETGLMYTLLKSDATINEGYTIKKEQKLHYVGIPVKGNWNFLERNRFTLYVSAGGMVEKSVYGEVHVRSYSANNEKSADSRHKQTVKPLQFSLLSALGAQFHLNRTIGIYVEPGVSYYFDDGSDVETIRKEHPFNFSFQMGMRFTY